jgi:hypothetical protein
VDQRASHHLPPVANAPLERSQLSIMELAGKLLMQSLHQGYAHHAQLVHMREIRRSQPSGFVHLAEEHFLGRPQRGPPTPHLPLQRPQLPLGEPTWLTALQLADDGLGLQTRLLFQHRANLRPDLGERIVPRRPVVRPSQLAGQLPQPYLRAVLSSMSVLAAATVSALPTVNNRHNFRTCLSVTIASLHP